MAARARASQVVAPAETWLRWIAGASFRRSHADPAELEHVHVLGLREVRHRQDQYVAQPVAGMSDEEETLAPVVVMRRDVG